MWIEIAYVEELAAKYDTVTPLAGVWIEIAKIMNTVMTLLVTPLAGVWIEIWSSSFCGGSTVVTPLAGVWIEIYRKKQMKERSLSLPLRECGLKLL